MSTVCLCVLMLSPRAARDALQSPCFKRTSNGSSQAGAALERACMALFGSLWTPVPPGLSVKFVVIPVSQKSPGASLGW